MSSIPSTTAVTFKRMREQIASGRCSVFTKVMDDSSTNKRQCEEKKKRHESLLAKVTNARHELESAKKNLETQSETLYGETKALVGGDIYVYGVGPFVLKQVDGVHGTYHDVYRIYANEEDAKRFVSAHPSFTVEGHPKRTLYIPMEITSPDEFMNLLPHINTTYKSAQLEDLSVVVSKVM